MATARAVLKKRTPTERMKDNIARLESMTSARGGERTEGDGERTEGEEGGESVEGGGEFRRERAREERVRMVEG